MVASSNRYCRSLILSSVIFTAILIRIEDPAKSYRIDCFPRRVGIREACSFVFERLSHPSLGGSRAALAISTVALSLLSHLARVAKWPTRNDVVE
jgi:hypothetical protein